MFAAALRSSLATYSRSQLRADVLAGLAVGVLAIPLAMALAIASGVPPQHGLYTAIVAGGACAAFGGSRLSVSGPTAAFVVLLAPISAQYGLGGLALATFLAGILLLGMGIARLGGLIQYIPYPVTTGFTAGIGVVIASLQIEDFLGLALLEHSSHFFERIVALSRALPTLHPVDTALGVGTLIGLVLAARFVRRVPAPLLAIPLAAVVAYALHRLGIADAATIGSRFQFVGDDGVVHAGIPSLLPGFAPPWELPDASGAPIGLDFELIRELLGPAFTIAMLGAIESLLCAVVADGMAGTRHDPDAELVGQGLGNMLGTFFGGIAATGAIARTATNVRAGARTPIAAMIHAGLVLGAVLALGPVLSEVPMAALAALLLVAAWNMSDVKHFRRILRIAPRSDKLVLLTCFALTVVFDMVIAVSVGVVLAALLFMRRMVETSNSRLLRADHPELDHALPNDVVLYEIAGPLFFGAAEKAVAALNRISGSCRRVILDLGAVPVLDVTGLIALESAIESLQKKGVGVVVARAQPQPRHAIVSGLASSVHVSFASSVKEAIALE